MSLITEVRSITGRAQATLVQDAVGGAALIVMLIVGLHLPSIF